MEERTALLLGEEGVARLRAAHVILFGLGGVGGHVAEALTRAGVGRLTLVDADTVAESNLNRQILALRENLGRPKVQVAAERARAINPACRAEPVEMFYLPENADRLPFAGANNVVDAVDTVTAKLEIIARAQAAGVPVISCMGTGNRLHPEMLRLGMLSQTSGCPLARVMRRECRARGLADLPVVYSEEPALTPGPSATPPEGRRRAVVGSVSFVPGAAGLILAGAGVRAIAGV